MFGEQNIIKSPQNAHRAVKKFMELIIIRFDESVFSFNLRDCGNMRFPEWEFRQYLISGNKLI